MRKYFWKLKMERFIFLLKAKVANKLNQKRHSKRILLFQEKAVISERYILCLERGSNYKTHTHTHTHTEEEEEEEERERNSSISKKSVVWPIGADNVPTQNHIGMAEKGVKGTVTFKGKQCKHMLTIEDVFNSSLALKAERQI